MSAVSLSPTRREPLLASAAAGMVSLLPAMLPITASADNAVNALQFMTSMETMRREEEGTLHESETDSGGCDAGCRKQLG
jgi:hypothetical protein